MALTINQASTLRLLSILNRTAAQQNGTMERLSTGLRINSGADDPAGLVAWHGLNAELAATDAAISNTQRAGSILDSADSGMTEIGGLLGEIETLVAKSSNSSGLSAGEIAANQAQIDSAIDSINRIVQTTTFNGSRILDGTLAINATASQPTKVSDIRIYSRRTNNASDALPVDVVATAAVASATLATPTVVSAASFSIAGELGTVTINVADGDTLSAIRDKIIAAAGETGVSATVVSGTSVHLQSRDYGGTAFVSVTRVSGDADFQSVATTTGTDASVKVNGQNALVEGLRVSFNVNGISGDFSLKPAGNVAGSAGTITINGGGATFQIGTMGATRATIGIDALASWQLGDSAHGYLNDLKSGGAHDLSKNDSDALAIVRAAQTQVAVEQGRIGGFQKYQVESALDGLSTTRLSLKDSISALTDTDFAQETANLSRQNMLMQSVTALLGVAAQQSAQILSLLR